MARQQTEKQKNALKKWREEEAPRDENGKIIINRRSNAEILEAKKAKLQKLEAQVEELKEEIKKLDASVNKKQIKDLIAGMTLDELKEKLGVK